VRCDYLILLECSSVHGTQQRHCGRRMLGLIVRITLNNPDSRGSRVERFGCVFLQTSWLSVRGPSHFTLHTSQDHCRLFNIFDHIIQQYYTKVQDRWEKNFYKKMKTFFLNILNQLVVWKKCYFKKVPLSSYTVYDTRTLAPTFRRKVSFDDHESGNRDIIMKATNKMQLYGLIYYS